jgi:glyoxylase-like metal-dependent hydrolase (beta-lactamase superfamily II)
MAVTQIVPGLWQIGLGIVNAFLIEEGGALTLIDTGVPGSDGKIMKAIADIARRAADVRRIVVTHCYPDLARGVRTLTSLAALDFDVACFGHGGPIKSDAARQFRRRWPAAAASPAA